jgi:hypothetical protein
MPPPSAPIANVSLLQHLPADISALRTRLFALSDPVQLPATEFRRVWPYVSNFWSWNSGTRDKDDVDDDMDISKSYRCRFHNKKDHIPSEKSQHARLKSSRTALACPARMTITRRDGIVTAQWSKKAIEKRHSHTLEYADITKRNSGITAVCKTEVMKGYGPSVVRRNLNGREKAANRDISVAAGAKFLSKKDVLNTTASIRRSNPDERGLKGNFEWETQRAEALKWCITEGWHARSIQVRSHFVKLFTDFY